MTADRRPAPSISQLRILVFDDDDADRLAVRRGLQQCGIPATIEETASASEALQHIKPQAFDCIFLGDSVARSESLALLRRIHGAGHDVAVVIVMKDSDDGVSLEFMKAGAVEFLSKASLTPERVAASCRDAIERSRATRPRRAGDYDFREHDRFRTLANAIPQLVWMADASGSIHWYNQRWYNFTGSTFEEMQGWGWRKVHHPDHLERVVEQIRHCFQIGEPWEDTFPLRGANGDYRWFLSRALPMRREDGSVAGWFGTNTDVTEQLEAKEAIRESEHRLRRALEMERTARAEAERATRARDETLAIVAHDLRNPLNAILAAASILALQAPDENSRRYLAVVERSAREMERLVSDLLDVARIEAGTFALRREALDVRALLEEAVEMFQAQARAKDIGCRCETAQDIRAISGDRDRLIQVLSNLFSNALNFSPAGRHVSVRATNDDRGVRISVKDSGAGIPEKDLPRVFDRFWQADPASKAGGAGLGLSICRGIVEAHGGRIWAASKVDRGTTFHFTVPFADS